MRTDHIFRFVGTGGADVPPGGKLFSLIPQKHPFVQTAFGAALTLGMELGVGGFHG